MTPEELSQHVREGFAYLARYVSLLSASESVNQLLARPDVSAVIADTLAQASRLSSDALREEWARGGGGPHQYLDWLLGDVERAYQVSGELHRALRQAEGTPASVRRAVLDVGSRAALRARLALHVAQTAARTMRQLEEGATEELAGASVWKQWLCRTDASGRPDERCCHWCRSLHRLVVPLHSDFPEGVPADLTGHGRLTRPPRLFHGVLPGPPRHPRCRCRIVILTNPPPGQVASSGGQEASAKSAPPGRPVTPGTVPFPLGTPSLLAASDIRALPEDRYQALTHFLRAAVHELGQVLSRLRRLSQP